MHDARRELSARPRRGAPRAASAPVASAPASGGTAACTVGMSWNNYQEERWAKWDEPAIKAAVEGGGGTYIANDAKSSAETQATNVENLISQGANVVIILAEDDVAIKPSVQSAIGEGIPVIAYDRLIEDPGVLYITFDNIEVGRMQAREIFKLVPAGNYAIIKGNEADANARFLRDGYEEIIGAAVTAGDIKIVGETFTDGWKPDVAQTNMEQILTSADNKVDAVLSENDGMAGGVVAALQAQGLAGKVPVSGQDGDQAALNRVALGTQAVDVWKDARELGKAAGDGRRRPVRQQGRVRGRRYGTVHDAGWQQVASHPARAAADPQGQPQRRRRRRLDHQGRALPGRDRHDRHRLPVASRYDVNLRPASRLRRGAGRFRPQPPNEASR